MKRDNARADGAIISKPEAVMRAIEELGYRAETREILEYVRARFGIDANTPSATIAPEPTNPASELPLELAAPTSEAPAEPVRKPIARRKPRKPNDSVE